MPGSVQTVDPANRGRPPEDWAIRKEGLDREAALVKELRERDATLRERETARLLLRHDPVMTLEGSPAL